MEFRQIRYFRMVSELGSFTKAAHELGVSQPSLSKQIRLLEGQLDAVLLIRDGRGVKLTAAGAELYERLVEIEDKLTQAKSVVTRLGAGANTISIGSTGLVGTEFLSDLVRAISAQHPAAEIRLIEGYSQQIAAWLHSGRLDIALLYGAKASQQAEELMHIEQDLFLIAGAEGDVSLDEPLGIAGLAGQPLIAFDQPSRLRDRFERAAGAAGVELRFRHAIDSFAVIRDLVIRGEGVAGLPFSAVAADVEAGRMQAHQIGGPHMQLDLKLMASRRSGLGREIYEVCNLLRDLLAGRCGSGRWKGCRILKG